MERTKKDNELRNSMRYLVKMNYVLIVLVAVAIGFSAYLSFQVFKGPSVVVTQPTTIPNNTGINFGSTIAGINNPFNATELATINNAPNSYFETAGEMLLNGSIVNFIYKGAVNKTLITSGFTANGKPSVIYMGAVSCIYCGENRWAMALALSRFGSFDSLYYGYSSFGDADVPTIFWSVYNYTTQQGMAYGNKYRSNYVNFISADYESPITQGFQVQPLSYFVKNAPNSTYSQAMQFMNNTNEFQGTPFTLWGGVLMPGADGVVFGNSMPSGNSVPLTYMTHAQVLQQLKNFNDQFSYSEYAAADVYIAFLCGSVNSSSSIASLPICSIPAIKALEKIQGLS